MRKIWKNRLQDVAPVVNMFYSKPFFPIPSFSSLSLHKNLRGEGKKGEKKEKGNIDRATAISRYLSFNHRLTMYNLIVYLPWKCILLNTIALFPF